MQRVSLLGSSRVMSLVIILCILTLVEFSQSCHRRMEYHHYYKKHPPKGHHGHGGGEGYGHSGGGYDQGHKGYGSHGHKGYGGEGNSHGHDDYGHHGGYHEGNHGGHQAGNHGNHHAGSHGGTYGHSGGEHNHGGGYPHGGGGHSGGQGGYPHEVGHNQGGKNYGHGGHGNGKGQKGHKYKYQTYESHHYNDKDGYQQPGYSHASPHYLQKGYGYSGPYPNTEYSNPVEASVNPPNHIYNVNSFDARTPQLDAADTADLIRNGFDSKENEIISQPYGLSSHSEILLSDSSGGSERTSDMIPTPTMELSSSPILNSPESKVDPSVGNFDMNLNFNSDLPVPFRRNFIESKNGSQRKRKRISSKYRSSPTRPHQSSDDNTANQSEQHQRDADPTKNGMIDNDNTINGDKPPDFVEFMNF